MLSGSTLYRVLLSGFVLTVTATTTIAGVAAAAPSTPAPGSPSPTVRVEALVLDTAPASGVTAPGGPAASGLPTKPLPRVTTRTSRSSAAGLRAPLERVTAAKPTASTPPKATKATRARSSASPASRRPASGHSTSLSQAVSRIPGYGAHRPTRWVLTSKYGHWGATDLSSGTVYVSPSVPASRLDDVVRHEWAHVLTIRVYGSASATVAGLDAYFGGSGITGAERAADCMARQLGATWTNYTSCSSPSWQRGAARLLQGRRP